MEKYDSYEDYMERGVGKHRPGDRIEREDGNTYIVCGDSFSLKDTNGVYVLTRTLERFSDQRSAELIYNSDIDTADSIYPEVVNA